MRAAWLEGPSSVVIRNLEDPRIRDPRDVIVDITYAGICGSDLWGYRGHIKRPSGPIGHEFIGRVSSVGDSVTSLRAGDSVIAPFMYSEGNCAECRRGLQPHCAQSGMWGKAGGGQAEPIRGPFADATLVKLPWSAAVIDADLARKLIPLADVFATGTHGAILAGVEQGSVVAVVGDGAVGISAAIAATRLGAGRVILIGRHDTRLAVAEQFGVETVREKHVGPLGEHLRELNNGELADQVVECVGHQAAFDAALSLVRPGGSMGFVGVPHGVEQLSPMRLFNNQTRIAGGVAPARRYLSQFVNDTFAGELDTSPLVDTVLPLSAVSAAYAAMDTSASLKVVLQVS